MSRPRIVYPDSRRSVIVGYDGDIPIELYDLLFFDGDDAKPAALQPDAGTPLQNQQAFGPRFLGVAGEGKSVLAGPGDIKVLTDVQAEFDCVAQTHEVGDLVTLEEADSGTQLENAKLVVTTDRTAAIGYVTRRDTVPTPRIQVRLVSRVLGNGVPQELPIAQAAAIPDPAENTAENNAAILSILAVLRGLGFVAT